MPRLTYKVTTAGLAVPVLVGAVLPDANVLIGLDLLLKGKLLFDGPMRLFTLDF
jgi:hypothetical protein